jgi:hypothetical protein
MLELSNNNDCDFTFSSEGYQLVIFGWRLEINLSGLKRKGNSQDNDKVKGALN